MIIDYKALLDKDDLISLFEWGELSEGGQRNKASKIMKSVKEQYKKDNGIHLYIRMYHNTLFQQKHS